VSTTETFSELAGGLEYPMHVVTAVIDGQPAGCLVGFATQCSIDHPRYLVCLSDKNHICRVAERSEALAVHFLPANAIDLARLFGSETGDDADKFAHCAWHPGPRGLPIIDACERWFASAILERTTLGDNVGHVLEPFAVQNAGTGALLGLQQVKKLEPGHGRRQERPHASPTCDVNAV
jgi:flavin reductase (DIM6/NTAB) family NADH-FMN oxidoreductase RutF